MFIKMETRPKIVAVTLLVLGLLIIFMSSSSGGNITGNVVQIGLEDPSLLVAFVVFLASAIGLVFIIRDIVRD